LAGAPKAIAFEVRARDFRSRDSLEPEETARFVKGEEELVGGKV